MPTIKQAAYALLERRGYFSKELASKLKEKGFSHKEIQPILVELSERGWLNDEERAARYAETLKRRGYGAKMVRLKLKEKVPHIELEIEDTQEQLLELLEKKYANDLPEKKDKVIRALLGKGFTYHLIKEALLYSGVSQGEDSL